MFNDEMKNMGINNKIYVWWKFDEFLLFDCMCEFGDREFIFWVFVIF